MSLEIVVSTSPERKPTDAKNFDMPQAIGIDEWEALFLKDLAFPEPKRREGEPRAQFLERWEISFKQMMDQKGYKLLGRIWHYDRDAFFYPWEVTELRNECSRLEGDIDSKLGMSALKNLVLACEQASNVGSGIWLISD